MNITKWPHAGLSEIHVDCEDTKFTSTYEMDFSDHKALCFSRRKAQCLPRQLWDCWQRSTLWTHKWSSQYTVSVYMHQNSPQCSITPQWQSEHSLGNVKFHISPSLHSIPTQVVGCHPCYTEQYNKHASMMLLNNEIAPNVKSAMNNVPWKDFSPTLSVVFGQLDASRSDQLVMTSFWHLYKFADRISISQFIHIQPTVDWTLADNAECTPSNRQHLSYDVCLEVRGEIIRTVLCCIVYWSRAQSWAVLTVLWIGFCLTGPISLCVDLFVFVYLCFFVSYCIVVVSL